MNPSNPDYEYTYMVYGMVVRSNVRMTGLLPYRGQNLANLTINLGAAPDCKSFGKNDNLRYTSRYVNDRGEPYLKAWEVDSGAYVRILYADGTEFWLNRDLNTLWARWPESLSLANTLCYLIGPVLGLFLRLRGVVCLHASAVAINDRSVVLVGPEGAGKSTTAAGFAQLGLAVLSDDIAALIENAHVFHVPAAYPRINLWPNSVELLYGSADALEPVMAGWDKRGLELGRTTEAQFDERTLPLGAIYILDNSTLESQNYLEQVSQRNALMMLIANTYATNFLDAKQRAEEFGLLSRLVSAVPVRKVNPRRNVLQVRELCSLIHQDFNDIVGLSL